jgi:hypothetical protein
MREFIQKYPIWFVVSALGIAFGIYVVVKIITDEPVQQEMPVTGSYSIEVTVPTVK